MFFQVYTGLVKMYRAEVLCKFPVIQHVKFGSVFSLEAASLPPSPGILATGKYSPLIGQILIT